MAAFRLLGNAYPASSTERSFSIRAGRPTVAANPIQGNRRIFLSVAAATSNGHFFLLVRLVGCTKD